MIDYARVVANTEIDIDRFCTRTRMSTKKGTGVVLKAIKSYLKDMTLVLKAKTAFETSHIVSRTDLDDPSKLSFQGRM